MCGFACVHSMQVFVLCVNSVGSHVDYNIKYRYMFVCRTCVCVCVWGGGSIYRLKPNRQFLGDVTVICIK